LNNTRQPVKKFQPPAAVWEWVPPKRGGRGGIVEMLFVKETIGQGWRELK
jgi:hypothetical protein